MRITFDVNLNITSDTQKDILSIVKIINQKINNVPTKQEFQTAIDEIVSAAENIAADIDRLAEQAEGGLSAADATEFVTKLQEVGTKLRAVADKNPETPTEPEEPTEPTEPTE